MLATWGTSMRLDCIAIENFKGLKSVEFRPTEFGCLVGENNAGKSSVLQAIVSALSRSGTLPIGLHYDAGLPVTFRLEFVGVAAADLRRLTEDHASKMSELVIGERLELIVRYAPEQKCDTRVMRRQPLNANFFPDAISAALQGKRPPNVAQVVQQLFPELAAGLPPDANVTVAKAHLTQRIAELPKSETEIVEGPLPTGISSSITALLPEPIYIPAVKNFGDDLKTSQSTTFGRLLGLLLEDLGPDLHQIQTSLQELNALLNRVGEGGDRLDRRHPRVRGLENRIEGFLQDNFPAIKLELSVPPPELRTILNTAQIFVDDGSRDLIDNKGDGIKRSLTFALLQTYVHHRTQTAQADLPEAPARRPLLFLFEEPELYLHPRSQRVLFDTLAKISVENQVVITTHSPLFFAPGVTASFVRVSKSPGTPKPEGKLFAVNFKLEPDNAEVFRLARFENADAAFFSRRVVLFEGESDDAFCRHAAKLLKEDWCFDTHSVSMVRVSGKGNFAKFRRFFEAFGLEVKIVADLDTIFEGYQHLEAPAPLADIRSTMLRGIDARAKALGMSPTPSTDQIKDKVRSYSFRDRYDQAKQTLEQVAKDGSVNAEAVALFASLFSWEQEGVRLRTCQEDEEARAMLVPLLDGLRAAGICVLSRGAIEEYYPAGTQGHAKPQRARDAIRLLPDRASLHAVSKPLQEGRECELSQIFAQLFAELAIASTGDANS